MSSYLWTNLKARLQHIKSTPGENFNWLFLPGGPGLGSESLSTLTQLLDLPGTIWHLDFPGDGSNTTPDDAKYFSHWSQALLEAVDVLKNVILVAHSTGGMYALSLPQLEKKLTGLVLMDSAPDTSWQNEFIAYVNTHPIKEAQKLQGQYHKKPSNELLKKITIAQAPYSFTKKGLRKGIAVLKSLPFNYKTCEWSAKHFDETYKAKWVPKKIPTLIFSGEQDNIIPLKFFLESKKFNRDNIMMGSIEAGGHFPWVENPEAVSQIFQEYILFLLENRK